MKKNVLIYLAGWISYVIFSWMLFPVLSITVMLTSIPLTMLGGWLYRYRGALITTLITIPYHYLMLSAQSDAANAFMEAFNPFGIISQLLFSCGTALLRHTEERYHLLNDSLQDLVKERTSELETLTNHLLDLQKEETEGFYEILLKKPHQELEAMLSTSDLLLRHLESTLNPRVKDAQTINNAIKECISDLLNISHDSSTVHERPAGLKSAIESLAKKMSTQSGIPIEIGSRSNWDRVDHGKSNFIYEIVVEAVTNALQHANPSFVQIGVEESETDIRIYVDNDGQSLSQNVAEGMGLPLMRYRASKIGAEFSIGSTNNKTRVACAIPHGPNRPN